MVNSSMAAEIIEQPNFEELSERVLLKALLVWVKLRFVVPLGLKYKEFDRDVPKLIDKISHDQAIAMVSDEDIWTMQRNASLFNIVARSFAKRFMTPELYGSYGSIEFHVDRKRRESHIAFLQTDYGQGQDLKPCIMYSKPHGQVLRDYKDHGYTHKHQVDIIPILKARRNSYLTPEENAAIDKAYNDFKDDPQFLERRQNIEVERMLEEKHLAAVLKAIKRRGDNADNKLAIAMHTVVDTTYKHDSHKVLKVTFNGNEASPVPDFSRLFVLNYEADLDYVKTILEGLIDHNIKINVGKGRILFTTKSGADPNDPKLVEQPGTIIIDSQAALDHYFDTHVGHITDVEDVELIMNKVLQYKNRNYY